MRDGHAEIIAYAYLQPVGVTDQSQGLCRPGHAVDWRFDRHGNSAHPHTHIGMNGDARLLYRILDEGDRLGEVPRHRSGRIGIDCQSKHSAVAGKSKELQEKKLSLLEKGKEMFRLGNHQQASEYLERYVENRPDANISQGLYYLARAKEDKGEYDEAKYLQE